MESFDSLVAAAAKQQKIRSELRARLQALSSQVSQFEGKSANLEEEELQLRTKIAVKVQNNDLLEAEKTSLLKSLGVDKAAHRSLNLTLDGLNEKKRRLQDVIEGNKKNYDERQHQWMNCYAMSAHLFTEDTDLSAADNMET